MSAISITELSGGFRIAFPYNPYIVTKVKEIPGRWFDSKHKVWMVPKTAGDEIDAFAKRFKVQIGESNEPEQTFEIPELPELTVEIPLKRNLFPFQAKGVAYAMEKKRLIIGDQPGLGKTSQAAATIEGLNAFPCLIICPSSLKINWQREFDIVSGRKCIILSDGVKNNFHKYYEAGMADVFIVNYESLKKYFVESITKPEGKPLRLNHIKFKNNIHFFKSVVIDESHRVKSFQSQQTKFTKGICTGKDVVLALTGTPVINKPIDLVPQLGIIGRVDDFGGYKKFVDRYCAGPKQASHLAELNYKLNLHCFYARKKSEVLKDLPAKMRQVVYCEIDAEHRREYEVAASDLITYLEQFKDYTQEQIDRAMRGEVMVRIGKLKNISAKGKLKDVFDFVDDVLASGEKLVLFGHLHEVLGKFKERYPDAVSITGEDAMNSRQGSVDSFQNNPNTKLAICSIQAAGVGLTLTASSRVAFVELGWHSAIHDQCEDRCHRIGQTDSVQCTYFLGKDTIDEHIYRIIEDKRAIASAITDSDDVVEVNIIDNFITLFNQKKL